MNDNNQALETTECRGCGSCTGACESTPKPPRVDPSQRFTTFDPLNELHSASKALIEALRAGSDPTPYLSSLETAVAVCDLLIDNRNEQHAAVKAAREIYEDDDISIDDDPIVAAASCGTWISAWLWVPIDDEVSPLK